jgi:predicted transcriptional regulator of viral defense system
MAQSLTDRVLALAKEQRIIRARDLEARGLPRDYLRRLVASGKLARIGRGVYALTPVSPTEHHSLAVAAKQIPGGVICLLSALRFHDLTTQQPNEVWMAIGSKAWKPAAKSVAVHVAYYGAGSLKAGVTTHEIEGVPVKIFSAAKTVADCFQHRRTVGLDVAIEALRDLLRKRKATVDEIQRYAQVCRVSRIIRPYLEALV